MTHQESSENQLELAAPKETIDICQVVKAAGGQAYLVGGWVRDKLLGQESKDLDIEVFGLNPSQTEAALSPFQATSEVGKTFGVYKIGSAIEVALARQETKTGSKHQDFKIELDPNLTPQQASQRRDFTINGLMYDPLEKKLLDFHQGQKDLKEKTIRLIDSQKFAEDPLRVYRAASIASRLGFSLEPETLKTCQQMLPELRHLPQERVSEEWRKILISSQPSIGLKVLEKMGIIKEYYPEIQAMINAKQDPIYHPEGDVWTHTLIALDWAAQNLKPAKLAVRLAILCHDIGKPATTSEKAGGRVNHYGHESKEVAEPLIKKLLARFTFEKYKHSELIQKAINLTADHMTIIRLTKNLADNQSIDRALRRLSVRLKPATLAELIQLGQADHAATQGKKDPFKGELLLEHSEKMAIAESQPQPILTGQDLINQGLKPGPTFGKILKTAYQAQIEGEIRNKQEALEWLKSSQPS